MIFLGDIASPNSYPLESSEVKRIFKDNIIVANLEGPLIEEPKKYIEDHILFSSKNLLDQLQKLNVKLLNLANNHIMDLGEHGLKQTRVFLKERKISYVGAGKTIQEASQPVIINENGQKYIFLSFGWEVIQCESACSKKAGVNPLRKAHVLKSIEAVKEQYPDGHLVVFFHWNYELELYPQPQDRELARLCIDYGAEAIIGCHSHLVQGIEMYHGSPIVYGLGNWFIPHNIFFNGRLKFPPATYLQLALEWSSKKEPICHWFEYNPGNHRIEYINSKNYSDSCRVNDLTPFKELSHEEYIEWFKKNRKKKKLLPIYKNVNDKFFNSLKNRWVSFRGKLIDILLDLRLKEIRNNLK